MLLKTTKYDNTYAILKEPVFFDKRLSC